MSRQRKHLAAAEKLAILKRSLIEKTPISDLCDQYGLQPSQIYHWQAQLFEHGASVFERKPGRRAKPADNAQNGKVAQLEALLAKKDAKLAQKNEVISELMEENVRAKKATGEL